MSTPPNRVDTLTATVDQLQAELERHDRAMLALALVVLGLTVLIAVLAWDQSCRP